MIETQPLEIEDFSGGLTDNFMDGAPNAYFEADNFIVTFNKKLYTRPGSELNSLINPQIPSGAVRIGAIIPFEGTLLVQSAKKIFFEDVTYQTLLGPSGNDVFSLGSTANFASWAEWNSHLFLTNDAFAKPVKIYKDGSNVLRARTAGLPALASSPSIAGTAGAFSYLYAFVHKYAYSVGNLGFEDQGPITIVQASNLDAPDVNPINISSIPVLVNGAGDNYDTANIKIEIYRTIDGGDTFFYVGEVTNGTTIYVDTVSDNTLLVSETLYSTGGILDKEPPPLCKYIHVTNNFAYYAYLQEGGVEFSNIIQQSFENDPDSTNPLFRVRVEDTIMGINSFNFTPIVFCRNSLYRLDGTYNADGSGLLDKQKISDTVGCVSNRSIVRTSKGTFFAGNDGFYWTDGFQVMKVSTEFNSRYLALEQKEKITGTYNVLEERVLWTCKRDGGSADNDSIFVLDLRFGIRPDSCFTTWSGKASFAPTALAYFNDKIIRADYRGFLFRHDETIYTDVIVDLLATPSDWYKQSIIYDYVSCAFKFGTSYMRKWVTRIVATASNETNLALQINSINDKGRRFASLRPITYKNTVIWGDEDLSWGEPDIIWNYEGVIEEQRRFPAKGIRCSYKQVQFTNAEVVISTSDIEGNAIVNGALKTATLVNLANADWVKNAVDYYLSFSNDNYTRQYRVSARSPDTLTFEDVQNFAPTGNFAWKLTGVPKNQVLNLLSYCLHYAVLGKTQVDFKG